MKIFQASLIISSIFIFGCATSDVPLAKAKPVSKEKLLAFQDSRPPFSSTITVIRDSGLTGSACHIAVYIDSTLAARLMPKQVAQFHVSPGEHLLRAAVDPKGGFICGGDSNAGQTIETVLKDSEIKNYRISLSMGGISIQRSELNN